MNITEAISILKIHQQWRLGADIVSIEPKELTAAMQVIIDVLNPENRSKMTEQLNHIVDTNKMVSDKVLFEQATVAMEEHYGYGCETEIDAYFRGAKWMEQEMEKLKDFDTWKEWKSKLD